MTVLVDERLRALGPTATPDAEVYAPTPVAAEIYFNSDFIPSLSRAHTTPVAGSMVSAMQGIASAAGVLSAAVRANLARFDNSTIHELLRGTPVSRRVGVDWAFPRFDEEPLSRGLSLADQVDVLDGPSDRPSAENHAGLIAWAALRSVLDLTNDQVAEATGIAVSTYYNWRAKPLVPRPSTVEPLLRLRALHAALSRNYGSERARAWFCDEVPSRLDRLRDSKGATMEAVLTQGYKELRDLALSRLDDPAAAPPLALDMDDPSHLLAASVVNFNDVESD